MIRVNRMQAIAELGRLKDTLDRLIQLPRRTATIAAPKLTALLQKQFRDGVDPYGRPWARLRPSTLAKHGPPPLTASGALRRGTRAEQPRANYAGIRLVVGERYGYFAQTGFRVGRTQVPPRRILPQYGMPSAWSAILKESARQAAKELTRGAR